MRTQKIGAFSCSFSTSPGRSKWWITCGQPFHQTVRPRAVHHADHMKTKSGLKRLRTSHKTSTNSSPLAIPILHLSRLFQSLGVLIKKHLIQIAKGHRGLRAHVDVSQTVFEPSVLVGRNGTVSPSYEYKPFIELAPMGPRFFQVSYHFGSHLECKSYLISTVRSRRQDACHMVNKAATHIHTV